MSFPIGQGNEKMVTTTSTWTDIVDELRDASATEAPIGIDLRFTLVDAADYIELLRRRLEEAERRWWKFW